MAGLPRPPSAKIRTASALSSAALSSTRAPSTIFEGQPPSYTCTVMPGTDARAFWSSRHPARNSCMPGGWLGLPAMRTIRLSAPRTGKVETATAAPRTASQTARPRKCEGVCMGGILPVFERFCIISLMAIEHRRTPWRICALLGFLAAGSMLPAGSAQAPPTPPPQSAEDLKSREVFVRVCVKCHPVERITAEGRSRAQWETTIITMQTARGAVVTPEEFDIIVDYLARNHGRESVIVPGAAARGAAGRGPRAHVGAADRHRVDDAAAARGQKTYASECVTCHAPSARGTDNGANLIRSTLVLRDRYGSAIGPFLKKGHPMQTGAPSASLTAAQITDLSHYIWQRVNDTLQGSPTYDVKNVLTGDAKAGQAYFAGEGRCTTCHSPTGDLAGYGRRYSPVDIQQRFVFPVGRGAWTRRRRGAAEARDGHGHAAQGSAPVSGVLLALDDFHVALRDGAGEYRSFTRTPAVTIVKTDPFVFHVELLDRLTDKSMHDVVAYLETLK